MLRSDPDLDAPQKEPKHDVHQLGIEESPCLCNKVDLFSGSVRNTNNKGKLLLFLTGLLFLSLPHSCLMLPLQGSIPPSYVLLARN